MPAIDISVDVSHVTAHLDAIGPSVHDALLAVAGPLAAEIDADARARAIAHFHSIGAEPGLYLAGFEDGTFDKGSRVGGYVRNANALAHLLEFGFEITDWEIVPGTGKNTKSYLGAIMAFEGDAGMVFRQAVHRHATHVQPYPALDPAFAAARGLIEAALEKAVSGAI